MRKITYSEYQNNIYIVLNYHVVTKIIMRRFIVNLYKTILKYASEYKKTVVTQYNLRCRN